MSADKLRLYDVRLMKYIYIYIVAMGMVLWLYMRRQKRVNTANKAKLEELLETGMVEPPSLHPVVDLTRCMGSGACAKACPELALGVVNGKAVLVNPAHCIGHGACLAACPVEAIKLVFGSEKRGIEIPNISPEFETNVSGIYIAGELGGMGLVRKAAEQGRQAINHIRKRAGPGADFDVVIVGSGPAGISAGLSSMEHKLRSCDGAVVERKKLGM